MTDVIDERFSLLTTTENWQLGSVDNNNILYRKRGEKNIYFLSSKDIIGSDGEATVDGAHFTDLGFTRYSKILYPIIKKRMKTQKSE